MHGGGVQLLVLPPPHAMNFDRFQSPNAQDERVSEFPPNMTLKGWMRWQENRWKMRDRQAAWIREQKAFAQRQENSKDRKCIRFQCDEADLVWLEAGQSRQTYNGFLVAKVPGWYCPKCAGAYGP